MRRGRGSGQRKGNHLHHRLDPRFRGLREIVPQHWRWNYRYYFTPQCSCCSVIQSCLTLHDPIDCSTRGFPVPHHLPEFAQVHVHCIGDATQPSHPLSSPSPSALNRLQHQGLCQWVGCLHQNTGRHLNAPKCPPPSSWICPCWKYLFLPFTVAVSFPTGLFISYSRIFFKNFLLTD